MFRTYSGVEKGPDLFGVIKRQRDNDLELHSNQQVSLLYNRCFSCEYSEASQKVKFNGTDCKFQPK